MINVNFFKKEGNHFLKHVKVSVVLMLFCVPSMFAGVTYAQRLLPSINLDNVTINRVFSEIEKGSDYVFLIADEVKPQLEKKVTVKADNRTVTSIMDQVLARSGLAYMVTGNQIAVYKQAGAQTAQQPAPAGITVTGTVVDEKGETVPGATLALKSNRQRGTVTDINGRYSIVVPTATETLVVSCIGMQTQEVALRPGVAVYNVKMASSDNTIGEVMVSTGIFQRDKTSFTGSIATFTGAEIKEVGNRSVLQSLAILDPSFVIVDNLEMGSNPNSMPTIELRGQGSADLEAVRDEFSADPNQPLFVLNGVIVNIERINDLDINRIESTTLLKDAGATAIYGSRGANGVVVIETFKPKPGDYQIYYNGTFTAEGPDLTVYNMMNAAEKLEFERLAGYYNNSALSSNLLQPMVQRAKVELYNERLANILRGVDTYWLSEPVRTAFSHQHSLRVAGGSEELAVEVGGKIGNRQGVMKGSKRDTWAGNVMLNYRKDRLLISNYTDITGITAIESPYGDFRDWVQASPYFQMRNEFGKPDKWLQKKIEVGGDGMALLTVVDYISNPLWNAGLRSYDEETGFNVINSTLIQYQLTQYLMVKGGADLAWSHKNAVVFIDSDHTKFVDDEESKKGTYEGSEFKTTAASGYLQGFYGRTFNELHTVGANARVVLSQQDNRFTKTEVEGFPRNSNGSPNLATSYKANSKPDFKFNTQREVGAIVALNYDYGRRYLVDFSYRLDGSTTFGSNKLFKPFWSAGLGWNINMEKFARDWKWADMLKLRMSIGTSGNQNIGEVTSTSVYRLHVESNNFGQGTYIESLGAPDLPWQVTQDMGIGADLRTMRGRLSLTLNAYHKKTDPLIVNVPQVPSTGLDKYPMHMGALTVKGFEWIVAYSPIYNLEERIIWTLRFTGAYNDGKYSGFGNKMDALNATMRASNELRQYRDGYSPTDIWAVRSAGIDPATGREVYITKDDRLTFIYNADDQVRVGNTRPDVLGAISTTFRYKNFSLFIALNYSLGGDIFNEALYNRVENISQSSILKNQDKRALYSRWKNPGDIVSFKAISVVSDATAEDAPISSRFVQRNNYLRASAMNLSYDFNQNPWLRRNLGIEMMSLTFQTSDLFRFETSKIERGITYPFARSYSLGLSLNF